MNNKGFTFIEILAVIVLIGILSSIAIIGVSRYRENAKNKDYEALAKSSYNAMEEYMIKHPYRKKASLEKLENGSFLSNRKDPGTKTTDCTGSVEVETEEDGSKGSMDKNKYTVYLCCTNYKKIYTYPEGKVEEYTGTDKCDYTEPEPDDTPPPSPTPGTTSYMLHYDDNGGSGCSSKTITRNAGEEWGSLCTPTRSGYKFIAWKNESNTISSTSKATANITVKAEWIKVEAPTCTITANKKPNGNGWYTSDVKLTLNIKGTATKSGLATSKNTINTIKTTTISKDGKYTYYGYVSNESGHNTCSININFDKTPPRCGNASGTSTTWTRNNRTIRQACTDATSKCEKASYDKTYTKNTKTDKIIIRDKAGNTAPCTYNVYVDKSAPTATFCRTTKNSSKRKCVHGDYCIKIDYVDNYALGKRTNLKEKWYGQTINWSNVSNLSGTTNGDELAVGYGQSTLKIISVTIYDEAGNNNSYSNKSYSSLSTCS